mmetsp:Transcript_119605/g.290288  ORF Transcript_119605/g.290288 Transcript_119605/m.290288 type:complete len:306 (-) Transcript_119605:93-1010(-)
MRRRRTSKCARSKRSSPRRGWSGTRINTCRCSRSPPFPSRSHRWAALVALVAQGGLAMARAAACLRGAAVTTPWRQRRRWAARRAAWLGCRTRQAAVRQAASRAVMPAAAGRQRPPTRARWRRRRPRRPRRQRPRRPLAADFAAEWPVVPTQARGQHPRRHPAVLAWHRHLEGRRCRQAQALRCHLRRRRRPWAAVWPASISPRRPQDPLLEATARLVLPVTARLPWAAWIAHHSRPHRVAAHLVAAHLPRRALIRSQDCRVAARRPQRIRLAACRRCPMLQPRARAPVVVGGTTAAMAMAAAAS